MSKSSAQTSRLLMLLLALPERTIVSLLRNIFASQLIGRREATRLHAVDCSCLDCKAPELGFARQKTQSYYIEKEVVSLHCRYANMQAPYAGQVPTFALDLLLHESCEVL